MREATLECDRVRQQFAAVMRLQVYGHSEVTNLNCCILNKF